MIGDLLDQTQQLHLDIFGNMILWWLYTSRLLLHYFQILTCIEELYFSFLTSDPKFNRSILDSDGGGNILHSTGRTFLIDNIFEEGGFADSTVSNKDDYMRLSLLLKWLSGNGITVIIIYKLYRKWVMEEGSGILKSG